MSKGVVLAKFVTRNEAFIVKEYLSENGILATVMGDDAGGALAGLSLSHGFKVLVPEEDKTLAEELLDNPPEPPNSDET